MRPDRLPLAEELKRARLPRRLQRVAGGIGLRTHVARPAAAFRTTTLRVVHHLRPV
jgi:hypothetical protein